MTEAPQTRVYQTRATSTDTFGRVLVSARDQHLIADGPVQNGCPGEAIGPGELFLSGVAACGVELIQVLAKQEGVPLRSVRASIEAMQDRNAPVRPDVSLFNTVRIHFELGGVTQDQGKFLVDRFKGR
ncbi:MAG TPA: OsmC family protein [Chloroflexota bacterium]